MLLHLPIELIGLIFKAGPLFCLKNLSQCNKKLRRIYCNQVRKIAIYSGLQRIPQLVQLYPHLRQIDNRAIIEEGLTASPPIWIKYNGRYFSQWNSDETRMTINLHLDTEALPNLLVYYLDWRQLGYYKILVNQADLPVVLERASGLTVRIKIVVTSATDFYILTNNAYRQLDRGRQRDIQPVAGACERIGQGV